MKAITCSQTSGRLNGLAVRLEMVAPAHQVEDALAHEVAAVEVDVVVERQDGDDRRRQQQQRLLLPRGRELELGRVRRRQQKRQQRRDIELHPCLG